MYLVEGHIDICHVEKGQEIVVDSLQPGSYLFSYSFLAKMPIKLTGIAKDKVSVLLLPTQSLNYARGISRKLREEISKIEDYISNNGVPKCDYTRY